MSSNTFILIDQVFWTSLHLAFAVLEIWIAILAFRKERLASWMILTGGILDPLGELLLFLSGFLLSRGWIDSVDFTIHLQVASRMGAGLGRLLFLAGLLLYLMRRKSESSRVGELEAIVHDLQQERSFPDTDPR